MTAMESENKPLQSRSSRKYGAGLALLIFVILAPAAGAIVADMLRVWGIVQRPGTHNTTQLAAFWWTMLFADTIGLVFARRDIGTGTTRTLLGTASVVLGFICILGIIVRIALLG